MKLRMWRQRQNVKCGGCHARTLGKPVFASRTSRQPLCERCAAAKYGVEAVASATRRPSTAVTEHTT